MKNLNLYLKYCCLKKRYILYYQRTQNGGRNEKVWDTCRWNLTIAEFLLSVIFPVVETICKFKHKIYVFVRVTGILDFLDTNRCIRVGQTVARSGLHFNQLVPPSEIKITPVRQRLQSVIFEKRFQRGQKGGFLGYS